MPDPIIEVAALGFPWATVDPFLFCVHHDDAYPKGNEQLGPEAPLSGRDLGQDFAGKDGWRMYHGRVVPGFPQHPHRGFETVTIARRGFIDHSDSLGATARFGKGDVQWLTAGKGIVHAEMFPLLERLKPNPTELFQIWLNLPRDHKMVEPHFAMLWGPHIPRHTLTDERGKKTEVTVIAGGMFGKTPPPPPPKSWAARPEADVGILTLALEPQATFTLPPTFNTTGRTLYFFAGDTLTVGGRKVPRGHLIRVRAEMPLVMKAGDQPVEILVLQGRPINEPVVSYGPFVMNTREEIAQAFADYRRTQFGGWPWREDDPVHLRDRGRFARHADGRVEQAPA